MLPATKTGKYLRSISTVRSGAFGIAAIVAGGLDHDPPRTHEHIDPLLELTGAVVGAVVRPEREIDHGVLSVSRLVFHRGRSRHAEHARARCARELRRHDDPEFVNADETAVVGIL